MSLFISGILIGLVIGLLIFGILEHKRLKPLDRETQIIQLLKAGIPIQYGSATPNGECVGTVYVNGVMKTESQEDYKIVERLMLTGRTQFKRPITSKDYGKCVPIELTDNSKLIFEPK